MNRLKSNELGYSRGYDKDPVSDIDARKSRYFELKTNDPDFFPATQKDVSRIFDAIREIRDIDYKRDADKESISESLIERSTLLDLDTTPDLFELSIFRWRLYVALLSVFISGGILAGAILANVSGLERVILCAMILPALGTAFANISILMKGREYDRIE